MSTQNIFMHLLEEMGKVETFLKGKKKVDFVINF